MSEEPDGTSRPPCQSNHRRPTNSSSTGPIMRSSEPSTMSEEPPPSHQLVFNRSDNAFFGPFPESGWDELIVWGGCVANCGEGTLSRLVDTNAAHLRSLIYMPTRTKGGVLIRPKYHCGDRGGRQSFPQLERMAIRLSPLVQPL
eukprot:5333937-Prymnesium_polylepis.1